MTSKTARKLIFASLFGAALAFGGAARAEEPYWPKDAKAYIISPKDGETVTGKVVVLFGLEGAGVAPAGVDRAKTGHHHLLIDREPPTAAELEAPLPVDAQTKHFGGGQTQVTLDLPPGPHTLQLLLGDQNHVPHSAPLLSPKVHITVK